VLAFTLLLSICAVGLATGDAPEPPAVRFVDVTGDGAPDKLLLGADGSLAIEVHVGGRAYLPIEQQLPRVQVQDVLVTDLDGNGFDDLYLVSPAANVALWGDGTGRFRDVTLELGLTDTGPGVTAERIDLDGDGYADLLLHNEPGDVLFWARADGSYDRDDSAPENDPASSRAGAGSADAGGGSGANADLDGTAGGVTAPGAPTSPPAPTLGSGGSLGTDLRASDADGMRKKDSVPAPPLGIPPFLQSLFDDKYVNDNLGEVDGADIADGSLTGADVSTSSGDVSFSGAVLTAEQGVFGINNLASGVGATVSGGLGHRATGSYSTVGGGHVNKAEYWYATVSGGAYNYAYNRYATIGGGYGNRADGDGTAIGGGLSNYATGAYAAVAGGKNNRAAGMNAAVGGGQGNRANGTSDTVAGGDSNLASGGGGAYLGWATVGGGYQNTASGPVSTVSGGKLNAATDEAATVGGGIYNTASGPGAVVSGGASNSAVSIGDTVGGGIGNQAEGPEYGWATVAGGYANKAKGQASTVSGGGDNEALGDFSTVAGGENNEALGELSAIAGGEHNEASGLLSMAAGAAAKAIHDRSFVWNSGPGSFSSTASDQFLIGSPGGVGVNVNNPGFLATSPSVMLDVDGTVRSRTGGFEFPDGTVQVSAAGGGGSGGLPLGSNGNTLRHDGVEWVASTNLQNEGTLINNVGGSIRSTRAGLADQYLDMDSTTFAGASITAHSQESNKKALVIQTQHSGNGSPLGSNFIDFRTPDPVSGQTSRLYIHEDGDVGIGTNTPSKLLHVAGSMKVDSTVDADTVTADTLNAGDVLVPLSFTFNAESADSFNTIYAKNGGTGSAAYFLSSAPTTAVLRLHQAGLGDYISTDGDKFEVKKSGRVVTTALEITGGGDLVEGFETGSGAETPGMVMIIDPESPGQLTVSTSPYDRKVAGVVSGAGGIAHGIRMGQDGVLDGETLLAMAGRVYVQCSTENGPIAPGDRLTTADLRGHAMRATDSARWDGAVIGKAMTGLDEGTGLVLVLVNLQ
jgi:hypothetical protein